MSGTDFSRGIAWDHSQPPKIGQKTIFKNLDLFFGGGAQGNPTPPPPTPLPSQGRGPRVIYPWALPGPGAPFKQADIRLDAPNRAAALVRARGEIATFAAARGIYLQSTALRTQVAPDISVLNLIVAAVLPTPRVPIANAAPFKMGVQGSQGLLK